MKKAILISIATLGLAAACNSSFDADSIPDATEQQVTHVEPLSWWTGMKTPLQLLVNGTNISEYDIRMEGAGGVSVKGIHKADSPNYLFADIQVPAGAKPGTYYLVFSKDGKDAFKQPYEISERQAGSADRESFTTADLVYLLCPDRFSNGDPSNDSTATAVEGVNRAQAFGRHGGDLQGMINHLDYIADLGATAIWPTPLLFDNAPRGSYHGYAAADYYQIDPRFGTNELFKAHEKGIKVIMDIVTNHCGTEHWWMNDLPFKDWIHVFDNYTRTSGRFSTVLDPHGSEYDRNLLVSGWFTGNMADMNLDNPFVLKYFQQWAIWWIEYSGLDGFRVDTYPYNEPIPMSRWNKAVTDEYPNFNIVGECWDGNTAGCAYWQMGNPNSDGFNSLLPSIMDFPLRDAMVSAFRSAYKDTDTPLQPQTRQGPGGRARAPRGGNVSSLYNVISKDFLIHDLSNLLVFGGNHDHARFADEIGEDPAKMKLFYTFLATVRGIPQIFYGDEMMFATHSQRKSDGELRLDFPGGWAGDEINLFTEEGRAAVASEDSTKEYYAAKELHDYARKLFQWRKRTPVIHTGKTLEFLPDNNTYAYFRYNDSDVVFVYINNSYEDAQVPWSRYSEISANLGEGTNVVTGEKVTVSDTTVVPANTALVVEYAK